MLDLKSSFALLFRETRTIPLEAPKNGDRPLLADAVKKLVARHAFGLRYYYAVLAMFSPPDNPAASKRLPTI